LFDLSIIEYITADREFIGGKWWDYLVHHKIPFYIRFRDNFDLTLKGGKVIKGHWILRTQKLNTPYFHPSIVTVNNVYVYFSGMKYYEKGELQFLMIASYNQVDQSFEIYKNRWQIETMFKAFKSSGFNLEDTHLIHYDRINKLLYIIALSFVWSYNMGIFLHHNVKKIRILKHGRRAKSFFKYGL
ncbi:transposase, partial [Flammeovirga sp. EKP202]|uniref:transposase n=1 Tax=Flammeovirga sp. EKP202 TaxID=2770592 RepID=UPI00165F6280